LHHVKILKEQLVQVIVLDQNGAFSICMVFGTS
jgi:hypothetical protein